MTISSTGVRWRVAGLELLPEDGRRYEIIDGVLFVTRAPHWKHQNVVGKAGHLVAAPELVVAVLSPGEKNERRDREAKLKIYSAYGVLEYWIADGPLRPVFDQRTQRKSEVYRREQGALKLAMSLYAEDALTSPVLAGFNVLVSQLFGSRR